MRREGRSGEGVLVFVLPEVPGDVNVSVVIATHGSDEWKDAAWSFAYPSAVAQDPWEVIVRHHPDGTLAKVRNFAASDATGEWLCFLDADDRLGDGYLGAMAVALGEAFERGLAPEYGKPFRYQPCVLFVPAVQYVEDGACLGDPEIPSWGRPLIEVNCAVIGTLIPRDLFFDVGGFREFPMYEDWDLWLRAVVAGARLVPVPDAVYCATRTAAGRNDRSRSEAAETYRRIRSEHEVAFERVRSPTPT